MGWWNHQGLTASCFLIHHSQDMAFVFTGQMVGRTLVIIPVFQTRGGRLEYFCKPLPLRVRWTQWLTSNEQKQQKWCDVTPEIRLQKDCSLSFSPPIPLSPFFSLPFPFASPSPPLGSRFSSLSCILRKPQSWPSSLKGSLMCNLELEVSCNPALKIPDL